MSPFTWRENPAVIMWHSTTDYIITANRRKINIIGANFIFY